MAVGNLAVSSSGQIIWYDFGMMSEIAPATKDRLMDMFYAVYRQDADAVISCLQDLGIIVPTGDIMPLRRAIAYFLENINRQAERQETLSAIGDSHICQSCCVCWLFPVHIFNLSNLQANSSDCYQDAFVSHVDY